MLVIRVSKTYFKDGNQYWYKKTISNLIGDYNE